VYWTLLVAWDGLDNNGITTGKRISQCTMEEKYGPQEYKSLLSLSDLLSKSKRKKGKTVTFKKKAWQTLP
jgi:hypothetical protein